MTFGICCILSWIMAGMILQEEKTILNEQEVAIEVQGKNKAAIEAQETVGSAIGSNGENDLRKEEL